ncbi:MAG TPA: acyl-CoA dehydrogenase family protein [Candidatus Limnocylindrales bacterium]|nr:acyl-CoA dehydrogenase family protein [Candidatus Limnocylindrales bacterium]
MDLSYGPKYEAFREEVRAFLEGEKHNAPSASIGLSEGSGQVRDWQKKLVEHGYASRTVPRDYGGFGAAPDLLENIIIDEEFRRAGASRGMANQGISMFVPTLLQYGSEEQKRRYIGPTIRGEMIWCQGYSEPGSGSDLASLKTSAVLDGDEFVINGQKIWTSTAREAQMMFALVRTEPDAPKHEGISYLLVDMKSPGITIRPLVMMTGQAGFNEVFFDNVRVPREILIGRRGQGWEVGKATLIHERNMLGAADLTESTYLGCVDVLREFGVLDHGVYRDRLMKLAARTQAMKYHSMRMLTDRLKKRPPNAAALIMKLNGCQLNHDIAKLAIDAMEEVGTLKRGSRHARADGAWQIGYMFQLGLIIGGGTAQIQKNIISEIGLGMPREPKAGTGTLSRR